MNYIIFPDKDATIYSGKEINTGLDQILEINKDITSGGISRILMHFDISNLEYYIIQNDLTGSKTPKFYLNLFTSTANQKTLNNEIFVYPLQKEWEMGTGVSDGISNDGATWKYYNSECTWSMAGSDYDNTISGSNNYGYNTQDLKIDITNVVNNWITTGTNNGLVIKRSDSQESDNITYGTISFYSLDTHTVYVPYLEMSYSDYKYYSNASSFITSSKAMISMPNLRKSYSENSVVRFDINITQAHKRKTFYEQLNVNIKNYIPQSDDFYYQIVDAYNGRVLVPFSSESRVSSDENGHYFKLNMSGYMPERFYKIVFKIISDNSDLYFDNNYVFKVVK